MVIDMPNGLKHIIALVCALGLYAAAHFQISAWLEPLGLWKHLITLPMGFVVGWNIAKYITEYYKPKPPAIPPLVQCIKHMAAYYDALDERFTTEDHTAHFVMEAPHRGKYEIDVKHTPPKTGNVIDIKNGKRH